MNDPRGSIWRKWDLQVHTPESVLNNQFGKDFDTYVETLFKKAIEKEIAVIGITDYFSIEGYKKIRREYLAKPDKLQELFTEEEIKKLTAITLLPNIEFRLNVLIDDTNRVNFHVIFSEDTSIDDIEENFLHQLHFAYEGNPNDEDEQWILTLRNLRTFGKKLKREHERFKGNGDLYVGMMCAVVDSTEIAKTLAGHKSMFEGRYVLCLPADEDLSSVSWDSQGHNVRKTLVQKSNILISSNKKTIHWGLGKKHEDTTEFIKEFKTIKPCIWGSDAHEYDELFNPSANKHTWIKADATFNGLKQIIYEPDERVKIQEANPSFIYNKPFFSHVNIVTEVGAFTDTKDQVFFSKTAMPLNKNLVSIIGGRGAGKSMLVDYWAHIFKNHRDLTLQGYSESPEFHLTYAKDNVLDATEETYVGSKDNYLDYIYIPQRRLKEITNKSKIGDEVKSLLRIEGSLFSLDVDNEIKKSLYAVEELREWFSREDEDGRKINNVDFVRALKKENAALLKSITTEANKKNLQIYTENIGAIKDLESNTMRLENLGRSIVEAKDVLNGLIESINLDLKEKPGCVAIPKIGFQVQSDVIKRNKTEVLSLRKKKENQNASIKKTFEKEGFTGDLVSLLENAETYKTQIEWAERRLDEISSKESELKDALQVRDGIGAKIKTEYENQKSMIDKAWSGIINKHEGIHQELIKRILLKDGKISVAGDIVFDEGEFYQRLYALQDHRKFRDIQALKEKLGIRSFEDWTKYVSSDLGEFIDDESVNRREEIRSLFFSLKERGDYLKTLPRITYDGKKLERLSVGQRGTVYLCLKLATDAFSKPIVFDQPEDDLDNEFITSELIDIFKELKQYRQIIIVTHNANLVVNADAEQVVIAHNVDEKLRYESGALEDSNINSQVCSILEGGREAFENRERKYGFHA